MVNHMAAISEICTPRQDLKAVPLSNPDLVLYVDGSGSKDPLTNENLVGYAVVSDQDILESNRLPAHLSAQAAEIYALTRACILAEGKTVTIY